MSTHPRWGTMADQNSTHVPLTEPGSYWSYLERVERSPTWVLVIFTQLLHGSPSPWHGWTCPHGCLDDVTSSVLPAVAPPEILATQSYEGALTGWSWVCSSVVRDTDKGSDCCRVWGLARDGLMRPDYLTVYLIYLFLVAGWQVVSVLIIKKKKKSILSLAAIGIILKSCGPFSGWWCSLGHL